MVDLCGGHWWLQGVTGGYWRLPGCLVVLHRCTVRHPLWRVQYCGNGQDLTGFFRPSGILCAIPDWSTALYGRADLSVYARPWEFRNHDAWEYWTPGWLEGLPAVDVAVRPDRYYLQRWTGMRMPLLLRRPLPVARGRGIKGLRGALEPPEGGKGVAGAHQGQTSREGEKDIWWTARTARGGTGHLGLTETQRGRLRTAYGQRCVDCKNSQTTPPTTSTSSICQLLGAADAQTAHPATFSTASTHQRLGSANAETTPAGAPAAAADRTQRPDASCEGKNG